MLSRPHRRRRRRRDRVRPARRVAVRAVVPRSRGPRADVRPRSTARRCTTSTTRSPPAACRSGSAPSLDALPRPRASFLVADPERVAAWRDAPGRDRARTRTSGMSWRSRVKTAERRLEYTRLDEWGDALRDPGRQLGQPPVRRLRARAARRPSGKFGVTIHRWEWLDLMNDFEEMAALDGARSTSSSRARNAVRDARRRARRAHRDDGQPLGLVGPRHRHVAVVPDDPARVPPPGRGVGRACSRPRPPPFATSRHRTHARPRTSTTKATEEHRCSISTVDDPAHRRHRLVRQRLRRARHALLARRDAARVLARRAEAVGDARPLRRRAGPLPDRRRARPRPHDPRRRGRRHRRARRGDEAGARVRVQPVRSGAHQRARRAARRRRRDRRAACARSSRSRPTRP